MGVTEVLTIIFIVLKLLGKIDWSWWIVCLPEIIAGVWYILLWILALTHTNRTFRQVERTFQDMDKF